MGYETFEMLCNEKKVRPAEVSRATGIATATLTNWKKGAYSPKQDKLQKIADYFGVSIECFTTDKNTSVSIQYNYDITPYEYEIILAYRKADDIDKHSVDRVLRLENREKEATA